MLTTRELVLVREQRVIVANFNVTLAAGESLWLLGANGRGKSSILKALAGLWSPYRGRILIHEKEAKRHDFQRHCAWLGHENALLDHLSSEEQLACARRLRPAKRHDRTLLSEGASNKEVLERLESFRDRSLSALSYGEQRFLALARLFESGKAIWLLDEPDDGLDEGAQAILTRICNQHLKGHGIIIAAGHRQPNWKIDQQVEI